jgi:hypothetical protein
MVVLLVMKRIETFFPREQRANLTLMTGQDGFSEGELRSTLEADGRKITSWAVTYFNSAGVRKLNVNCCGGRSGLARIRLRSSSNWLGVPASRNWNGGVEP